ncbi:septum formation family protein [Actinomadura parmotrematis]|uniref:Septum formation family protein n=1 Tax=Actinomadura parmotrematis TaxID=2864039 RepID=A0ABS7FVB5_9ACTN|nr:septum formation family protein [Actinomadura parmotrematis]MBW8483507.1 septum formation family protein [Actinomadura parmotrematis]
MTAPREGRRGKRLAVGGVAAGFACVAALALLAGLCTGTVRAPGRAADGRLTGRGRVTVDRLRVGDCVTGFRGERSGRTVTALPCDRPHNAELVAAPAVPAADHPTAARASAAAGRLCDAATRRLRVKSRYAGVLRNVFLAPDPEKGGGGDGAARCILWIPGGDRLDAPLAASVDPAVRLWTELATGDCLAGDRADAAGLYRTVPCSRPHRAQVVAAETLGGGAWPGTKTVKKESANRCERPWAEASHAAGAPRGLKPYYLYPLKENWAGGERSVVCLMVSPEKSLERSLVR